MTEERNQDLPMSVIYWLLTSLMQRLCLDAIQDAKKPLKEFKKLAKKYSTCTSGSKKGDLGEFVEGQMVQDFEEEVWSMQPETIPQRFIKTQFGFHIIWVHSITLPDTD